MSNLDGNPMRRVPYTKRQHEHGGSESKCEHAQPALPRVAPTSGGHAVERLTSRFRHAVRLRDLELPVGVWLGNRLRDCSAQPSR